MIEQIAIFSAFAVLAILVIRYGTANRAWFNRYRASDAAVSRVRLSLRGLIAAMPFAKERGIAPFFTPDADPETERLRGIMVSRLRPLLWLWNAFAVVFPVFLGVVILVMLARATLT
jgi:hypothetical protein